MQRPAPISLNRRVWEEYLSTQKAQLPDLPDVEDLSDRVTRIMGGNPGLMQLQGTNTYLVGRGKSKILIDTGQGFPIWIDNLVKILEQRDWDIRYVLLTHWHGDHCGGVPDLVRYDSKFASRIFKNQPDRGQQPIEDGQVFETEGATLTAIHTPGHANDHCCFILEEENALFTGDNVLGHGYSVCEDLATYMESLHYMEDQNCEAGYPAHGTKIPNLPQKMKEYIRQKEMREQHVFSALMGNKAKHVKAGDNGKGGLTIRELVYELHGEVPTDIYEMALEPFTTEVLWKLAQDRKVGFELSRGDKKWFINQRIWQIEGHLRA